MPPDDTRGHVHLKQQAHSLQEPARPAELGDIAQLIFPRWLDYDPTTGGPHYLGHVMVLLMIALPLLLITLAVSVALV